MPRPAKSENKEVSKVCIMHIKERRRRDGLRSPCFRYHRSGALLKDLIELFVMANKLNDGLNKNEVQLVSKNKENKGFFEKFFQLFS